MVAIAEATRPTAIPQEAARALAARDGDQEAYAAAVHNINYQPYQPTWVEALETLDRVVLVCPPDTYKSTTVRHYVEKAIGSNPNIRILWIMNAGEQAEKQIMAIRATIESNNVYRQAFHIVEDTKAQWTKSVLFAVRDITDPDPTLMGAGLNGHYLLFSLLPSIHDPEDADVGILANEPLYRMPNSGGFESVGRADNNHTVERLQSLYPGHLVRLILDVVDGSSISFLVTVTRSKGTSRRQREGLSRYCRHHCQQPYLL